MKSNNLPTQQQRQPASPDEKISDANRLEDDANVRFLNDYPWQPEYRYRQFFFKECAVAGLSFHLEKNDDLWFELNEGTKLALIRQRDNPNDPNAVAVALADDYDGNPEDFDFDFILGYIPRTENAEIAAMMDAGYADKFSAEITTYNLSESLNNRIRITICIESCKPEIIRPNLLRATTISASTFADMNRSLTDKGTAYFRFGGFPPHELMHPDVGEKIVLLYQGKNQYILYLMRVLATNDQCAPYLDVPEERPFPDDCSPLILTNIMGPIKINSGEYEFLSRVNSMHLSATNYLSPELSQCFTTLFASILPQEISNRNFDTTPDID